MTILVQCPHCETKFNLQPDMAGKSMRCPNIECRQTFLVKASAPPTEPPAPSVVAPTKRKAPPLALPPDPPGMPPDPSERAAPPKPRKPEKPRPPQPAIVEATIVEAAIVATPKVKEVVWSEGTDVPPTKGKKPLRAAALDEPEDDLPIVRRKKKKKNRGPIILIGMAVTIVFLIGFGVLYILRFQDLTEGKLAQQAEEEYKKADYAAAEKSFNKLTADYPESESAPKYKFFADLSSMQVTVKAVTNRENPEPVVEKLRTFIEKQKDSPFAKHTTGFGRDIYEAGRKLGEDVVAHADDRVKAYKADRTKTGELDRATKTVAYGRGFLPLLEPFRGPDEPQLDAIRQGLDQAEADVKHENNRTAALAKAASTLQTLSDAAIQLAEADLSVAGFLSDPDAQAMIAAAKGKLREQVKFEPDAAAPQTPPESAAATILFVAPVGPTRNPEDAPTTVFLAVAQGILYALDENGKFLWAARVGPDVTDPPAVVQVDLGQGLIDLAVVTSNVGGRPALTGYEVKTGTAKWYQELTVPGSGPTAGSRVPVPAAGPAVVVGSRVFVSLRDPEGSIYVFDVANGARIGRIRLWQAAGSGLAVHADTGLLYAAADARRVYVIDTGLSNDAGQRPDPACVQMIATDHPAGTLRTPPLFIGPDPAERWMVLTQADGPTTTKLRAFPLSQVSTSTDGKTPPETAATPSVELPIPGWVWFSPADDGEHLALATDSGQVRLFGVNQPGNFDKALFPYSPPSLPAPPAGTAVPGLMFPAEEAAYWVLANGEMQKYRLALIPRGMELVPIGPRIALGVPTQPPQFNNRKDAACLVVRSLNSAGCKAVLMNVRDGEIRWQRQLGVVPVAAPIPQNGGVMLAAENGELLVIPAESGVVPGQTTVAPPAWTIASAPENVTQPTVMAVSADGKTAFAVTQIVVTEDRKPVAKYLIRRVAGGKVVHEGTVTAPGTIVGQPVVLGESLLIPISDGFVHRHAAGTGRTNPDTLTAGPQWGSDRRSADAVCHITPTSATSFLIDDGKKLNLWNWPKGSGSSLGVSWDLNERPAGPGVMLQSTSPDDSPRLLIADVTGSVWLFASDRGGQPLRRWRPGTNFPAGKPTSPFTIQMDAANRPVVAYTVENKFVVCLDPDREMPKWVAQIGEEADATLVGAPQPAGAGRWLATDLAGRVTVLGANGEKVGTLAIGLPGAVPGAAASMVGGDVLAPLSDGSAVMLSLPTAPAPVPDPKPKE